MVIQVHDGKLWVVFYLSRRVLDVESRYPEIEKLCLCLFFTCTKLHHILLSAKTIVISYVESRTREVDVCTVKVWYPVPTHKAVKGQALADLIAESINTDIATLSVHAWAMYIDGSACGDGCGIGILLVSPWGAAYSFSIRLPTPCTNNLAEYEAVRKGMELHLEAGAEAVEIFGDSKLVISQLTEEYRCKSESLLPLWE
jgi:hypothetical protein